jgi:hypothetical protein
MHFCKWFLQAVRDCVFEPKFTFCIDDAWFHLSGYINAQSFKARVYRSDPYTAEDLKRSISFPRMSLCEYVMGLPGMCTEQ